MRRTWFTRIAVTLILLGGTTLGAIWWIATAPLPSPDVPTLNAARHQVEEHWGDLDATDLASIDAQVSVIGSDGSIILVGGRQATAQPAPSELDQLELLSHNASQRVLSAPIMAGGSMVGMIVVDDGANDALRASRIRVAAAASAAILATLGIVLLTLNLLHRRIIRPFRRLESFARAVASGNLDLPLPMDRGQVFGAWSESFDLMRQELASARDQEAEAKASKVRFIADVGHDIRTPLSTIATTTELIRATSTDPNQDQRLGLVLAQVQRIDSLVADLVGTHTIAEPTLDISPAEVDTPALTALISENDPQHLIDLDPLPDALVNIDPDRFAQVMGNIVANSYKYAATRITVAGQLVTGHLKLSITDHGAGLAAGELPLLTQRGYRGSNATGVPGHGLGLHTAASLMSQMGGHLQPTLAPDGGFTVILRLPLA